MRRNTSAESEYAMTQVIMESNAAFKSPGALMK